MLLIILTFSKSTILFFCYFTTFYKRARIASARFSLFSPGKSCIMTTSLIVGVLRLYTLPSFFTVYLRIILIRCFVIISTKKTPYSPYDESNYYQTPVPSLIVITHKSRFKSFLNPSNLH